MSNASSKQTTSRQRKAVVPPAVITEDMSLFDYLAACQPPLDQKIIDIACAQSQVPGDLKKDAGQEIRLMWATLKPDTKSFKPGQIAAYAHRMACHAALRLRRELGSSVRLPGSAFRKRKDGSSYVTPGVLAAAVEWEKLEGWYGVGDDGPDMPIAVDHSELSYAGLEEGAELVVQEDEEAAVREARLEVLEQHRDHLTPQQYSIMKGLIDGATFDDIMKEHNIKKGVLMREMAIISSIVDVPVLGGGYTAV